jgi:hypothetical protein
MYASSRDNSGKLLIGRSDTDQSIRYSNARKMQGEMEDITISVQI